MIRRLYPLFFLALFATASHAAPVQSVTEEPRITVYTERSDATVSALYFPIYQLFTDDGGLGIAMTVEDGDHKHSILIYGDQELTYQIHISYEVPGHKNLSKKLFLFPGENPVVAVEQLPGYDRELVIRNSPVYEQEREFGLNVLQPIVQEQRALYRQMGEKNDQRGTPEHNELARRFQELQDSITILRIEYIRHHPDTLLAGYLLQYLPEQTLFSELYERLGENVRSGPLREFIEANKVLHQSLSSYEEIRQGLYQLPFVPEFTLATPDERAIRLSDLYGQGKYILLDFWGSWCGSCVAGIPKLKELHERFSDKLTIISVNSDTNRESWLKGIEKYDLNWINVFDGNQGPIAESYGVDIFSTKALISPEGKLIDIKTVKDIDHFYANLIELLETE